MAAGLQSGDNPGELQVNNLKAIKHIKSQLNDADKMATRAGEFFKSPAFSNSLENNTKEIPNIENGYCNGTVQNLEVIQKFQENRIISSLFCVYLLPRKKFDF